MKSFKGTILAALAVLVAISGAMLPVSQAAAQGSASLSIAPKKNYVIEPGKTVEDTLTIRNLDRNRDLELNMRVVDFTFTDDGGTPKLFLDEDAAQTTWSLKPFLKVPRSVDIPKGGSKTVDIDIKIPKNQGAGSFYSAIVYSTGAPEGGNVGLAASGVTLAFVNVPGQVNESLKLENFGAYNEPQKKYVYFATQEPLKVAYTLKNDGNVTEAPVGSITLKPWFGEPISISNVNPNESLALIGQTRTYTACIKLKDAEINFNGQQATAKQCEVPGLWPGYYAASLDLYYGQNGNRTQEIIGQGGFWYLPWWFLILVTVILIALAILIWRLYSKIRNKMNGGRPSKSRSSRRK